LPAKRLWTFQSSPKNLNRASALQNTLEGLTIVSRPRQHLAAWQATRTHYRPMPKLVFKLSDSQSLDFPLVGQRVRLGRNASNEIVIDNSWISSFHAEFLISADGTAEVRDLNSSNGTMVNGQRIKSAPLRPGDVIVFGQLEAIFDPVPETLPTQRELPAPTLKGPRLAKPVPPPALGDPAMPPSSGTAPVPVPAPMTAKRATPPTGPVPVREDAALRNELLQVKTELAALRGESKELAERVESLRREREAEEKIQAQQRLQGEREAGELRSRIESLRLELEKQATAAAETARERREKLEAEEQETARRIAALESAAANAANELKSGEERLLALRSEEAGLAAVSERMKAALNEAHDLAERNAAALASAGEAELNAAAAARELTRLEEAAATARAAQSAAETAAAAAAQKLQDLESGTAAREAELATLTKQLESSRLEIETSAARLAEIEQAAAAGESQREALDSALAETAARREALMADIKVAEAKLKSSADQLRRVDEAQEKLSEIEAAIAAATARTRAAEEESLAAVRQKETIFSDLAEAQRESQELADSISKLTAELAVLTTARTEAAAEIASLRSNCERELAERRSESEKELARLKESLAEQSSAITEAAGRLAQIKSEVGAFESALKLRQEQAAAGAAAAEADEVRAAAVQTRQEIAANKSLLTTLAAEITALTEQRTSAGRAAAAVRSELEVLEKQAASASAAAVAAEQQRADCATLQTRAAELEDRIQRLEERRRTFADAPDANWGTAHAMAKSIIKQVDLLDDLIHYQQSHNGSRELIEQWSIFRAGLTDLLGEYCVAPFTFEPGFVVDVSARKKIQIVENRNDGGEGTRIEKTWRPGYLCTNGSDGAPTLLRKAEVSVVIGQ
jgi:chromosome segregation ATPase